jgi:hypothetical protein
MIAARSIMSAPIERRSIGRLSPLQRPMFFLGRLAQGNEFDGLAYLLDRKCLFMT